MDPRIRVAKIAVDLLEKLRQSSRLKGDIKPLRSKIFELMYIEDIEYLKEEAKFFEDFDYSSLKIKDDAKEIADWAIEILKGLRKRFERGKGSSVLLGLEAGIGEVVSTSMLNEKLKICKIEGKHGSLTVITNMLDVKKGDKLPYVILPPRKFEGVYSQAMFVWKPINSIEEVDWQEVEGKVSAVLEEYER